MTLANSLKSLPWRQVLGLLLAGLLGWLLAFLPGRQGAPPEQAPLVLPADPVPPRAGATPEAPPANGPPASFEQLMQKQAQISEGAQRAQLAPPLPGASAAAAGNRAAAAASRPEASREAREARTRALIELQNRAIAEIQAIPPGDTRQMLAAMTRYDAQMRAAGVPSVIDLEKLRLTLESTDRMQELGRQLIAESEKGRGADPVRVKALSAEIQAAYKNVPQQFIRNDVLQRQLKP
jgi:hypothetical protein